jgi:ankyrin repeat protein
VLLDAGADFAAVTRIGSHTPLHVASKVGSGVVVETLLAAGADPNAMTTTGVTSLHLSAASGDIKAVRALLAYQVNINVREAGWGQTPLMFASASNRVAVIEALLEAGADTQMTGKVVDIAARDKVDREDARARRERISRLRDQLMGIERPKPAVGQPGPVSEPSPTPTTASAQPSEQLEASAMEVDLQEEPEPLGYPDLVGAHGGLTALLLAAREGHAAATRTLLAWGADINGLSSSDRTSPMLMATINGHLDLAMYLLHQGAAPTLASDAGATPLYAALNMHWAPKSRHPQPTDYMQEETSYLTLMEATLDAGADVNARLTKSLWYTTYNRDLLGVGRTGATPFWRAAYALDVRAMRMLLQHGADPTLPTLKVPERQRRGDDTDHSGLPPIPLGGPAVYPIHAASGVGYGAGFAANSHRHVPDGWLPTVKFLVEELGADVNARDHQGYTPVHHAAARGDNELIEYFVSKGADVTAVSRRGHTTADLANGPVQRTQPFPHTIDLLVNLGATNNNRCVSC